MPKSFRRMTFGSAYKEFLCLLHFAWSHVISGIYPAISVIPDNDCFMPRVTQQEGFHAALIELEKTREDIFRTSWLLYLSMSVVLPLGKISIQAILTVRFWASLA